MVLPVTRPVTFSVLRYDAGSVRPVMCSVLRYDVASY